MAAPSTALARIIEQRSWWAYKPQSGPTPRPMSVRIARPDEEEKIFASLMSLAEENALAPVSEAKVRAAIKQCGGPAPGEQRTGVIGIVDAPDDGVAAMTGIVMGQVWYSTAWHCEDIWTYVHPEFRSGKLNYAKMLIQFGKWWSEQLGMPLFIGVASTTRTLGKLRLYAREVPLVGASFLWKGGV